MFDFYYNFFFFTLSSWPLEIKCLDRFEFGSALFAQTNEFILKDQKDSLGSAH